MAIIEASGLNKDFIVYKREKGVAGTLKSLFKREHSIKHAVSDISFSIDKGELVGYIGPNGAGKSTTIKMVTGILYPTSGSILVRGIVPHQNRRENAMNIGVVFGQRSQLYWDLPLYEALGLYRKMYKVESKRFDENVERFTEILEMGEFINRPIRQLSLGQKMRAELTVALLHDPEIVYLDEPTIGLDVVAKSRIREFIKTINAERQTTVMLTTHDMADIEELCTRLILIDKGRLIYDGTIEAFRDRFGGDSYIEFTYEGEAVSEFELQGCRDLKEITASKGARRMSIAFDKKQHNSASVMKVLMDIYKITDFTLKEPSLEDILKEIYTTNCDKGYIAEQ